MVTPQKDNGEQFYCTVMAAKKWICLVVDIIMSVNKQCRQYDQFPPVSKHGFSLVVLQNAHIRY